MKLEGVSEELDPLHISRIEVNSSTANGILLRELLVHSLGIGKQEIIVFGVRVKSVILNPTKIDGAIVHIDDCVIIGGSIYLGPNRLRIGRDSLQARPMRRNEKARKIQADSENTQQ